MNIYIAQDWHGNIYIVDQKDCLPPDVTDFREIWLGDKNNFVRAEVNVTVDIGKLLILDHPFNRPISYVIKH